MVVGGRETETLLGRGTWRVMMTLLGKDQNERDG